MVKFSLVYHSKTKHMRMNANSTEAIHLGGNIIEEVTEFTYLGAKFNLILKLMGLVMQR